MLGSQNPETKVQLILGHYTSEQAYWRAFIGSSRKRLAQAAGVIYPGFIWDGDPNPLVDSLFPIAEIRGMLNDLPDDEPLDDGEAEGIARIRRLLFEGKFPTRANPSGV